MKKWRPISRLVLVAGTTLFLGGCDPTLRATVENGIINVSTSLFGAFLRALIELGQEAQADQTAALLDQAVRMLA